MYQIQSNKMRECI